jgi:hypothetical protein
VGKASGEAMQATHITSPITTCSVPSVSRSTAATGVRSARSGWILGCTIGTHVTVANCAMATTRAPIRNCRDRRSNSAIGEQSNPLYSVFSTSVHGFSAAPCQSAAGRCGSPRSLPRYRAVEPRLLGCSADIEGILHRSDGFDIYIPSCKMDTACCPSWPDRVTTSSGSRESTWR